MPEWLEFLAGLVERLALPTVLLLLGLVAVGSAVFGLWKAVWPLYVKERERKVAREDAEAAFRQAQVEKQTTVMERQATVLEQLGRTLEEVGREVRDSRLEQQAQGAQIQEAFEETNRAVKATSDALTLQLGYSRQFNEDLLVMRRQVKK